MKNILLIGFVLFISVACRKRLDGFLFNPSQIENYQLDAYQGEVSLDLNGAFGVPATMIHQLQWDVELKRARLK